MKIKLLKLKGTNGFVKITWHHLEDGKTLVPVKSSIHSNINAPHTGGFAILKRDLEGFFN